MSKKEMIDPKLNALICDTPTDYTRLSKIYSDLVELTQKKNAEYGASWCRRGGQGAYFTMIRKFDRLETQMKNRAFDILNPLLDDPTSTESVDETIKDAINYLGLILERRQNIRDKLTIKSDDPSEATPKYVNQ
jgi:hypothetical protein